MHENCTLIVDDELVNRLGRALVVGFEGIGPANQALLREHIHNTLMAEWRRQQESSWAEGMEELEALSNQFPSE